MRALVLWLLFSAASDGGVDLKAAAAPFVPSGWEAGDCPASYGTDTVLCAGTDSGPYKVDRHIPTLFVRALKGDCQKAAADARQDPESKGFTLSSDAAGRCATARVPCVERIYGVPGSPGAALRVEYLLCASGADPMLVGYAVSGQVRAWFLPFARTQVRWTPDAPR
jgi:hypothetical protein